MSDPLDRRPAGVDDATVAALGKLSEALEYAIRVRGRLYDVHQLVGRADLLIGEAVSQLRAAGHAELAERIERDVVGRNVLAGRWTFQIVEEFDDGYYAAVVDAERAARETLVGGVRHVYEAEMKRDRRSAGEPGHEAAPLE
jgi:hypothetical protein